MFFFYSFQNKIPHCTQKMRIQERKIPGYIRVWYDSNTFSKENKEKPIHFQQKIRRHFPCAALCLKNVLSMMAGRDVTRSMSMKNITLEELAQQRIDEFTGALRKSIL